MKILNQLTFGDKVFVASEGNTKYHEYSVTKVDADGFKFGNDTIYRKDNDFTKDVVKVYGSYHYRAYVFSNEASCARYCKAQLMKELFNKIEAAKLAVDEVKKFRDFNYELLNHNYTDKVINQLSRSY